MADPSQLRVISVFTPFEISLSEGVVKAKTYCCRLESKNEDGSWSIVSWHRNSEEAAEACRKWHKERNDG